MSTNANISLVYHNSEANDRRITTTRMELSGERTQYLPTVLDTFVSFLQSMGYTYVTELIAVSDNDNEYTSDDVTVLEADGLFDDEAKEDEKDDF